MRRARKSPRKAGSDLCLAAGDRDLPTSIAAARPHFDEGAQYRAICLIQTFGVRPEMATMLAALAFGGGR